MRAELEPFPEVVDADDPGPDPPNDFHDYVGTRLRAPKSPLVIIPATLSELTGPAYGESAISPLDADLTKQHAGEPLGERIIVSGRVLDADGKPLRGQLVEIWQANASGRYPHLVDQHDAPLDPNFSRRRPLRHRRRWTVQVHHGEARLLPLGEPPERLAAEPHPLLAVRARVHGSARDADVLPR